MMYRGEAVTKDFKIREKLALALIKHSGIEFLECGIFGSYSRGDYNSTSDIDICMIVSEHPDRMLSGTLREKLEILKVELIYVRPDYFSNSQEPFAVNLRRDYKRRILDGN